MHNRHDIVFQCVLCVCECDGPLSSTAPTVIFMSFCQRTPAPAARVAAFDFSPPPTGRRRHFPPPAPLWDHDNISIIRPPLPTTNISSLTRHFLCSACDAQRLPAREGCSRSIPLPRESVPTRPCCACCAVTPCLCSAPPL